MSLVVKRKKMTRTRTVIKLGTQKRRSDFARSEMRAEGLSINELAMKTGHCWETVHNYIMGFTTWPRTDTTINIFKALGYDVTLKKGSGSSKGTVIL